MTFAVFRVFYGHAAYALFYTNNIELCMGTNSLPTPPPKCVRNLWTASKN